MQCPCDSGKTYSDCCEAYLTSHAFAPTPVALMRSRYTAFVLKNLDYLQETMHPPASRHFDLKETAEFVEKAHWQGLTVFNTKLKTPTKGFVSFDAVYRLDNQVFHICEKSEFHKVDNRWFYVDGKPLNPAGRH